MGMPPAASAMLGGGGTPVDAGAAPMGAMMASHAPVGKRQKHKHAKKAAGRRKHGGRKKN